MSRSLNILYVSYPLLPISNESCGGAEQILCSVERALNQRGHRTIVAACSGSQVAGELLDTGAPPNRPDAFEQRQAEHHAAILNFLSQCREQVDLIHDHSGGFWPLAHELELPVLATLHLPRDSYPHSAFQCLARNVSLNCVSQTQFEQFRDLPSVVGIVENGIDLQLFQPGTTEKENYLLWMGRICEEKGPHVALDVAAMTGLPIVLLGRVYPFSYHEQYYHREIVPRLKRLDERAQHICSASIEEKIALLEKARVVLIPSLVEETSSLAAMEAMACGTPVIAFRRGALAEIVQDGVNGFLADSVGDMARKVTQTPEIDSCDCRRNVERFHSAERMWDQYELLYERLTEGSRNAASLAA